MKSKQSKRSGGPFPLIGGVVYRIKGPVVRETSVMGGTTYPLSCS